MDAITFVSQDLNILEKYAMIQQNDKLVKSPFKSFVNCAETETNDLRKQRMFQNIKSAKMFRK